MQLDNMQHLEVVKILNVINNLNHLGGDLNPSHKDLVHYSTKYM
jgi:hypothetical protein